MNSRLPLVTLLAALIVFPVALCVLPVSAVQDIPILGYPYVAHQASGTGQSYFVYGSNFHLNGAATITSMSTLMYIAYDITTPDEDTTYRFAIYQDNSGSVGQLIGQTESGSISKPAVVYPPMQEDDWQTLNFDTPLSLSAGTYWLVVAAHGPNVMVYNDMSNQSYQMAMSYLESLTFPSTLTSVNYINNDVCAIYASGQGTPSLAAAPSPDANNPGMSTLSVNCQNVDSAAGKVEIFGRLSVYGASLPQEPLEFAYRVLGDVAWQPIATTTTSSDGTYSVDWFPPAPGNYQINATFWGNTISSFAFKAINVLVAASGENQSKTVFSVDSNSTVADLAFDSSTSQLRFSVTGSTGTTGYVDVCISKDLATDPSAIQAFIDGNQTSYTVTSGEDCWILHFAYHHSSHDIIFSLEGADTPTTPEMPSAALPLILTALFAVAVAVVVLKRRNTNP
ncbi:MAG: hypothetical protein NWE92_03625 [Candidatus Bathyarchaeota archaeon]|nr:hypothetical protein [Candidatus Bathyarchaeota archaeon]